MRACDRRGLQQFFLADPARVLDVLAEAQLDALFTNRDQPALLLRGDEKAQRIGADVDDCHPHIGDSGHPTGRRPFGDEQNAGRSYARVARRAGGRCSSLVVLPARTAGGPTNGKIRRRTGGRRPATTATRVTAGGHFSCVSAWGLFLVGTPW